MAAECSKALDVSGIREAMLWATEATRAFEGIRHEYDGVMRAFGGNGALLMGKSLQQYVESLGLLTQLPEQAVAFKAFNEIVQRSFDFSAFERMRLAYEPISQAAAAAAMVTEQANFSPGVWRGIYRRFDVMQVAYAKLVADPAALRLPQVAQAGLPEIDVRIHGSLIRSFETEEPAEEELAQLADLAAEIPASTVRDVSAIAPRLGERLKLALRDIGSTDPRTAAHACVDIRQVLFGLLNKLAPTDAVKAWARAQNDKLLWRDQKVGGEISHKARVLYLSRGDLPESSSYSRFLVANADAIVSFLGVVNKEVHDESPEEPTVKLTPISVRHLLFRASCIFGELLICAEGQKEGSS
jgi:hypothetical protein